MIRNYLITAWRNIMRHKVFSLINLLGLAIGMTVSIILFHYVYIELSFDNFHSDKERVYRLISENTQMKSGISVTNEFVGPRLKDAFPEIEVATRIMHRRGSTSFMQDGELKGFTEPSYYYADSSFFEMFSFQPSDPQGLHQPNSMMLSESKARQYFGSESAVGKIVTLYDDFGQVDYTVRGTFPDVPANSHLQFDFLVSFHHLMGPVYSERYLKGWRAFFNYVLLKPGTSIEGLEVKFPEFIASTAEFKDAGADESETLLLQPLEDIHLHSNFSFDRALTTNIYWIYFLSAIAFIVMLLAWVNYINLSSARSFDRAKEVGIRKVLGSHRSQLIFQFLLESVILNILAIAIGFYLLQLLSPLLQQYFDFPFEMAELLSFSPLFLLLILGFFFTGAIISSLYPAFFLSKIKVVNALKNQIQPVKKGFGMQKAMVVFQFAVSLVMLIATFVVFKQTAYMQSQSLGLNIDQTLVIQSPSIVDSTFDDKMEVLKQELLSQSGISDVLASGSLPGKYFNFQTGVKLTHQTETERVPGEVAYVQPGYFEHFKVPVLFGQKFFEKIDQNNSKVIVNEAMLSKLHLPVNSDVLGKQLTLGNSTTPATIIGVVKNYHHNSLRYNYDPIVFNVGEVTNYLSVRMQTEASDLPALMASIEESYQELFPANPFEAEFLDEVFDKQYQEERMMGNYTGVFSGLAIVIACLGLLGLSIFSVQKRTREIGIRKVLGASAESILYLLSKDYLKLILIAVFISIPLSIWGINQWLESFAFPMELSWMLFVAPVLLLVFISMMTILGNTLMAVRTDPVEVLRNE